MSRYRIPQHVHFCVSDDAVVFMDLKKDKYSMIRGTEALTFITTPSVTGNGIGDGAPKEVSTSREDFPDPLPGLVQEGLLAESGKRLKPAIPTQIEPVEECLVDSQAISNVRFTSAELWAFFMACVTTTLRLRLQPIEKVVSAIESRKRRLKRGSELDYVEARRLVAVFNRLRGMFPHNYLCLFDSIALVEFLARYGLFPVLVFAVRIDPWAAHCWVQQSNILFNDDVEAIEEYIPIATI